ncbi:hypothetical protein CU098_012806 [Rhizopus stolonifer]|uniref:E2F/DP family winged-helix DNA-binding domain-containing protein n=1 Tax=Rhizopus stolonifer TaxID=4846 RepID=A0A367KS03_RHIST|nr:hypothetical protein CU098_012806 [Rhizopus stolonifer]
MTCSAFVPYSMMSALPSPPLSNQQKPTMMMDRAHSSDKRSTNRDVAELRPFLNNNNKSEPCLLPPIQAVMMNTPYPSPSPPSIADHYFSPSSFSSLDDEQQNVRRKGSIASLLNSDPELKQLDSSRYDFFDTLPPLKRGRPKQDEVMEHPQKKPCLEDNSSLSFSARSTKGLRHFSRQVCDKVAEKGITSYNEVADELAFDIQNSTGRIHKSSYDQKNIRRRVYDALNVLMAMNIIQKDKKVIKWLGIPECYQQTNNEKALLEQIEQEKLRQNELIESLQRLRESINGKLQKHLNIRSLILRNQDNHTLFAQQSSRIALPFFMIACKQDDTINIDMSIDSRSAMISFHQASSELNSNIVYEDADILNHLRLNSTLCS